MLALFCWFLFVDGFLWLFLGSFGGWRCLVLAAAMSLISSLSGRRDDGYFDFRLTVIYCLFEIYATTYSSHLGVSIYTYTNPLQLGHRYRSRLNLDANSSVSNIAPRVVISSSSARIWLLVLICPPISVRQSCTSHWNPRVEIHSGPNRGMMPTFSSRRCPPSPPTWSGVSSLGRFARGVRITFRPGRKMNVILSSETR